MKLEKWMENQNADRLGRDIKTSELPKEVKNSFSTIQKELNSSYQKTAQNLKRQNQNII